MYEITEDDWDRLIEHGKGYAIQATQHRCMAPAFFLVDDNGQAKSLFVGLGFDICEHMKAKLCAELGAVLAKDEINPLLVCHTCFCTDQETDETVCLVQAMSRDGQRRMIAGKLLDLEESTDIVGWEDYEGPDFSEIEMLFAAARTVSHAINRVN